MTAFKRYCKAKGFVTEEDFPCMPYQRLGSNIVVESIRFDPENAKIITDMNIGTEILYLGRDGEVTNFDFI